MKGETDVHVILNMQYVLPVILNLHYIIDICGVYPTSKT